MSAPAHPTAAQSAGGDAEEIAARYLASHGLRIVQRNYRTRLGEIDLIAQEGGLLVFVEVRLRNSERFGGAVGSIHARKRARIIAAARQFLMRMRREPACRFDVVTVEGRVPTWLRGAFEAD